jgi:hypothetical protein
MVRVERVAPLEGYQLRVGFTDGTERVIDVGPYLRGAVFAPVRNDRAFFEAVEVDRELGTIVWPNGADIDPDVLYGVARPGWMERETR